jgi:hypothetical protein
VRTGGCIAYVLLEVVGHLVLAGEGVGVEVEFQAREAVVPGRAVGDQRVPAAGAPGLGDAVALQYQVRHASLLRCSLMATPAWPAPTTRVSISRLFSVMSEPLFRRLLLRSVGRTAVAWGQTRDGW